MTKLVEWLTAFVILVGVWLALLTNKLGSNTIEENFKIILWSPVALGLLFGVYAASVVLYRTFTFKNCEEEALELFEELKEVHSELSKLGFIFPEKASS